MRGGTVEVICFSLYASIYVFVFLFFLGDVVSDV